MKQKVKEIKLVIGGKTLYYRRVKHMTDQSKKGQAIWLFLCEKKLIVTPRNLSLFELPNSQIIPSIFLVDALVCL